MNQNRLGRRGGIKNFGQWRNNHGGNNNQNNNNRQQHSEHDDRKPGVTELKRRVTFKTAGGRGGRGMGIRLSDVRVRQQLEADQDMAGDVEVSMHGKTGGFRGRGGRGMRGRRSGSPPPRMMGFQVRNEELTNIRAEFTHVESERMNNF